MFVKQRIAIIEWAENHERFFDDRAVIVLAFYFLGAIIVGRSPRGQNDAGA